jgi:signal transduction histidine kinase
MAWLTSTISVQQSARFEAAGLGVPARHAWMEEQEFRDLGEIFSDIRRQTVAGAKAGFRVIVIGAPRNLRSEVADAVYLIGHEALSNAFRHSQASDIEVEIEYSANCLRVLVRDNGCGIDERILRLRRDGQWGLSLMKERGEKVGGSLRVLSHAAAGTEIEFSIPGSAAFAFPSEERPVSWLSRLFS